MSHHQRHHSQGSVPFSWEYQPGVSKVNPQADYTPATLPARAAIKLQPPPCPSDSPRPSRHSLYVPLPPCTFQPLPRSTGLKKEEDPFLAAYMECTKSVKPSSKGSKMSGISTKLMAGLGCKYSCGVREGGVVRLSQLPVLRQSKRFSETKWALANKQLVKHEQPESKRVPGYKQFI